eukprot:TRINITY_DN16098_c0_g1_i1.p1 TRINITY_DN16098_c0_g1~~TRINITY_DN16098_c0_g1_i1.p1  ORF type:complete len:243 (-),score=21.75 TRINITY_DN16098_c0_g1_i1:434-1162(-)
MAEGGGGLGSEQRHNRYHAESEEDPSRQPLTARQDSQLDAHPSGAQQLGPWTTRLLRAITRRGDFNSPLPQGAVWQLSWLQLLIPLCAVVFLVGVFFQVWCAIDGLIVLKKEHNVPTQCSALRFWALGYCMVVLCAPCAPGCLGLPVVMAALYILAGRVVRARVTGECEEQVSAFWPPWTSIHTCLCSWCHCSGPSWTNAVAGACLPWNALSSSPCWVASSRVEYCECKRHWEATGLHLRRS